MENLSIAIEGNAKAFENTINQALGQVSKFNQQVNNLKAPTLPTPKLPVDQIAKTLDELNTRLRVAQGNAELFGNQFEADKLKVIAFQQALNSLLSQGLSPTSKEVLNLANHIEKLSTELDESAKAAAKNNLYASFQKTGRIIPDLEAKAKRLQAAMRNATNVKDIDRYQKRLERVNNELAELGQRGARSANQLAGGMNKLGGSASTVSMEFTRIIQDAPYGFIGIGNNIQQLTANFGQLQRQAGGTGAAIKASLAAMISPTSLLTLGISAITAGWVLYEKYTQKSAKATQEGAAAMKDAQQVASEYIGSLNAVGQARVKGAQDAQQELTTLKLLYRQTQDVSRSYSDRKKAVDELQKQYPDYFKNMSDEDILAGKAAAAYDKLTSSLLATARARAAQDLIAEKSRQQLINEEKIADLRRKELETESKYAKDLEAVSKVQEALRKQGDNSQANAANMLQTRQLEEQNKIVGERQKLELENIKLAEEMLRLEKMVNTDSLVSSDSTKGKSDTDYLKQLQEGFNQATKEAILFGYEFDEMGTKAGLFKTAIVGLMEQGLTPNNSLIQALTESYRFFAANALPSAGTAVQNFIKNDLNALRAELVKVASQPLPAFNIAPMSESAKAFFAQMVAEAEAAMGKIEITAEQMTSFMQASIANAITGIAESFGQLAATGDASAFFDSIIGIVADFAGNFGKLLIGAGVAALAFQGLLANPLAAIAAGGVLVAAAGAVKSLLAAGPTGGAPSVSTGGASGSGGFRSTGTSYEGPDELRFRIEGSDLVAVMAREQYKQQRIRG